MNARRAIFMDRDGTINEMVYDETHGLLDSPRRPEQVTLVPGAAAFIRQAHAAGCLVVVVSNQPGVAKGTLTMPELDAVNQRLAELLALEGARWDAIRCCPHHPSGRPGSTSSLVRRCDCRKPQPGLLVQAAAELDIDLPQSWMIGDGLVDIQAGRRAGCRTLLLANLKIAEIERFHRMDDAMPNAVCRNYAEAATQLWGTVPAGQDEGHTP